MVDINWSTVSETNNDYFTLERSADGNTFGGIDIIKGAGNSSVQIDYYEVDKTPLTGISYYRLKQTDFDGKYTYSKKVPVEINDKVFEIESVYPNPFNNSINVNCTVPGGGNITVAICNSIGQPVYNQQLTAEQGINVFTINAITIPSGLYFLKITDSMGNVKTSTLNKD